MHASPFFQELTLRRAEQEEGKMREEEEENLLRIRHLQSILPPSHTYLTHPRLPLLYPVPSTLLP